MVEISIFKKQTIFKKQLWDGVGDGMEVQEGGDICIPMADSC